ncbi:hypothetical protein [Streptomyces cyaneofuscatus]|uniref:hypothetical protein n=1 Tax=Streptomyces cyaneofuscatus TaxID=66883 RepID=UPI0033BC84E7
MSESPSEKPRWRGLWWADSIWSSHAMPEGGVAPSLVGDVRAMLQARRGDNFSLAETLQLLIALQNATDRVLHEVVAQARSENHKHSWRQIGDCLGVTRTAAQKRFGKGLSESHRIFLECELGYAIDSLRDELKEVEEQIRLYGSHRDDEEFMDVLHKRIEILEGRRSWTPPHVDSKAVED